MAYRQIIDEDRYIPMALGRHRSTIVREIARNSIKHDGYSRPVLVDS